MKLHQKIFLAVSLIMFANAMRAVGEVATLVAGAAFGVGYKKVIETQPVLASVPLVMGGLMLELMVSLLISQDAWQRAELNTKREQTECLSRNIMLIYGASVATACILEGVDYAQGGNQKEPAQELAKK